MKQAIVIAAFCEFGGAVLLVSGWALGRSCSRAPAAAARACLPPLAPHPRPAPRALPVSPCREQE